MHWFALMMGWLNSNSAAIQALATIVLVLVTWQYVRLTASLARAASAQLVIEYRAAAARRRELRTLADLVERALATLPSPDDSRMHAAVVDRANDLSDFSFSRFRALAAEVSQKAGMKAVEIERHFSRLDEIKRFARNPAYPTFLSNFPKTEYDEAVRFATGAVRELVVEIDRADLDPSVQNQRAQLITIASRLL